MSQSCLDLEVGLTLAGMRDLATYGVPDVTAWSYTPYSRVEVGGDGRPRGFGYSTASWTWDVLSQDQLNSLLALFASNADASVAVYIYTYTDVGASLGAMRERFSAVMSRPVDGGGKTMVTESRTPVYSDITINFTHMVVA
jgi:hypothetical protein